GYFANNVQVLLGNGLGAFDPPLSVNVPAPCSQVATGDLNGDHKADLALVCGNSPNVGISLLLATGGGAFQTMPGIPFSGIAGLRTLTTADLNGDGKLDLVAAGDITLTNVGVSASAVYTIPGNGDGTFRSPSRYPTGPAPAVVVAADFNQDGKPDLATVAL